MLNACGVRCGHQQVLTHRQTLGEPIVWGDYEGDASFDAALMLSRLDLKDIRVTLVVRDPLQVIRSWMELGVFYDSMWQTHEMFAQVLSLHLPQVMQHDRPIERAARYYLDWNAAADRYAHTVFALENMSPLDLFGSINRLDDFNAGIANGISRATNCRWWDKARRVQSLVSSDLPDWFWSELRGQQWIQRIIKGAS
jgi:hypothetical protein